MIIILLFITNVLSAEFLVEKQYGFVDVANLIELNQCIIYEGSLKYQKVDEKTYKICTYTSQDCSGTEECGDNIEIIQNSMVFTTQIPTHIAHGIQGIKENCSDHKERHEISIFYGDCLQSRQHRNVYLKYIIENNSIYALYFSDDKCTLPVDEQPDETPENDDEDESSDSNTNDTILLKSTVGPKVEIAKCDICENGIQYYCKPYTVVNNNNSDGKKDKNGSMITSLLLFIVLLFFLF